MQQGANSSSYLYRAMASEPEAPPPPHPAQIVFVPLESGNVYSKYKHVQSKISGAIQIVIGVLSIIFNATEISYVNLIHGPSVIGHGIWCGIVFTIAGSFGVAAGFSKTKCKIIAFMVLCIVSAAMTTIQLSFGIISALISLVDRHHGCIIWSSSRYNEADCETAHNVAFAMGTCMAILAVTEACVAIWGSTICCKVACCGAAQPVAGVFYHSSNPSEILLIGPQGQPGQFQFLPTSVSAVATSEVQQPRGPSSQLVVQPGATQPTQLPSAPYAGQQLHLQRQSPDDSMEKPLLTY